ncbi:hypothetical protein THOM_0537 [Trachipleistophora hominis]|uniref:Myb/SANT-like DNA-binding domain-containing protein n=1 Tax=Trachipleistophora hominis TaxID=72359 RepID=L7JYJ9_TRAHO|nr:hypothetical protein THOM_0537 [Trachipleistophora hominis]
MQIYDKVEKIGELQRKYNELRDEYKNLKCKYREKHLIEKYLKDAISKK